MSAGTLNMHAPLSHISLTTRFALLSGITGALYTRRHRIENEKGRKERLVAAAAEKKRQAKLKRARERENRKKAASARARHEEEMERIER